MAMKKENSSREKLLDAAFLEVYTQGYHGAATAQILKSAGVPKGSMYHHFDSKKSLVLALITERILPKMDQFFTFERADNESAYACIKRTFRHMGINKPLITYGCPLYRLMVEMSSLDEEFERAVNSGFEHFLLRLKKVLDAGVEEGEFRAFDTREFSEFLITASWGRLSLSPSLSSSKAFKSHSNFILQLLKQQQN